VNKKIIFIIAGVLLFAIIVVVIFKKGSSSVQIKNGKVTSVPGLLSQAKESEAKEDPAGARLSYQALVSEFPNSSEVMNWQKKIDDLNIRILFSPAITPKSVLYEIKSGDTLAKIAKQFNTTVELIKKSNNLKQDIIIPGKKVKVWTAPFTILVDKSQNILILKSDEDIFKTYIVSTGANNSTPVGTFKIVNKLTNPTWFKAGAVVPSGSSDNVLGTRWMGFNLAGYGIHGTTEPQNLGKQVTQGCVRMANQEVEELYAIVPVGTEVAVVD